MSAIEIKTDTLKETKPYEYVLRFVFGGAITAAVGIVAHRYGPVVGGLFLAFPSIMPAAITLLAKHESEKHGTEKGKDAAAEDAAGSAIGGVGLAAFAILLWLSVGKLTPPLILLLGTLLWFTISAGLWALQFLRRRMKPLWQTSSPSSANTAAVHRPSPAKSPTASATNSGITR